MPSQGKTFKNIRFGLPPFMVIAVITVVTIAISIYCLMSGWFIIFQNLFYIPIIIACSCYAIRGFAFSIILSLIYLLLIIVFTKDPVIVAQAFARVVIFNFVAGVVTYLTIMHKRMEDAFKESEHKIRAVFDQTFQFVGLMTLDGILIEANRVALEFAGIKEADVINKPFWETPWWTHSPELQKKVREATKIVANGGFAHFEATHMAKDGSLHYVDFSLKPVKDDKGNIIFLLPEGRDITDRKILEKELMEFEKLKASSEIKSKFTSMVSHELRSPLGAIKEGISLVEEGLVGDVNEKQKELLAISRRNVDRLTRLINNVLNFQKIGSGKMAFDMGENDINAVAMESVRETSLLVTGKELRLEVDLDDRIPKITFDRDKIIQVMNNLLSNAMKFTETGSITIKTKLENDVVHVTVRDTGIGIKDNDTQKLFRPFEQLEGSTDKKKGGSGLGLAISKEIILAHNGKMWAESKFGEGSVFHFTLPIK